MFLCQMLHCGAICKDYRRECAQSTHALNNPRRSLDPGCPARCPLNGRRGLGPDELFAIDGCANRTSFPQRWE